MAARPVGMLLSVPLTSVCKIWMETPKAVANWRFYWGQADRKVGTGMRRQVLRYALSFSIIRWPDMYRIVLGKVSTLSAAPLPRLYAIKHRKVHDANAGWRGVIAFAHAFPATGDHLWRTRQTAFAPETPLWFNLSHSGDDIACC